jgi:uncharacterized protein YndB with AHSA1/START domain
MEKQLGKVAKENDGYRVVLVRTLNHSIQKVWAAITDPDKLKIWFTEFEIDFRVGGKMNIFFNDAAHTKTTAEIITIDPPKRFVYSWEGELADWQLTELGAKECKLTLTYSKLSPEYAGSAPAGFHSLLDQLEVVLNGRTEPFSFGADESDPEQLKLRDKYNEVVYKDYPELRRYEPVIVEKTYNATIDKVWSAITEKEKMKEWYFDLDEFKPEVGFEFQFTGTGTKGEQYVHHCKVTEVKPKEKLAYSWRYEGLEGDSTVSFELFPEGDKTRLRLVHRGLGSFPDETDFRRESFMGGWTEIITVSLDKFLEKE